MFNRGGSSSTATAAGQNITPGLCSNTNEGNGGATCSAHYP